MVRTKSVINRQDFIRDLDRGHIGEDIVELFLCREFGVLADNVSAGNPDHDLIISSLAPRLAKGGAAAQRRKLKTIFTNCFGYPKKKELTVEVKFDQAAARYKNIFIEIFYNVDKGVAGAIFNCKADIIAWVVPGRKKYNIYLFKRPELLAWLYMYIQENKTKLKTPTISPKARGLPIPISKVSKSYACVGCYVFKM